MTKDEAFESPRMLLAAAQEELEKLVAAQRTFFRDPQTTAVVEEIDPKTGNCLIKLRLRNKPPPSIRMSIYRLVSDLRNALDQALFAAWLIYDGTEPDKDIYFPFGGTEPDFRAAVRRRVPEPLWETFYSFEAYRHSDTSLTEKDLLFALSRISGPNKHRIAIGVNVDPAHIDFGDVAGGGIMFPACSWDRAKNEMVLLHVAPWGHVKYDLNVPLFISFEKVRSVDRQPVATFAELWIGRVGEIVERIASEVAPRTE